MGKLTGKDICTAGSNIYANNVACGVDAYITDFVEKALASETALNTALDELAAIYEANIVPSYYQNLTGSIDKSFTLPSSNPTRPDYSLKIPNYVSLPQAQALVDSDEFSEAIDRAVAKIQADANLPNRESHLSQTEFNNLIEATITRVETALGLPARGLVLTESDLNAIYNRARARLARQSKANTKELLDG